MTRIYIVAFLQWCMCTNILWAQKAELQGKVLGQLNKQPIEFVNVYLESVHTVVYTQKDGSYLLNNLNAGTYFLCASHVGYKKCRTQINLKPGINKYNIQLSAVSDTLSAIVVTGTGTHYKIDNAPVQTEIISKKDIEKISGRNVEEILTNAFSSIDYISSSMGTNLKINGLGSDYVLVLVNGKRLTGGIGGYTDLSRINSEGIEQIEIVKGASSTLYGSDAMSGVINIITKKTKQKFEVTNSSRVGEYGDLKQLNSVSFNHGKLMSKTSLSIKQTDGWQLSNMEYNTQWKQNHDLPYLEETYDMPVNKKRSYTINQAITYDVSKVFNVNADFSWHEKTLYFPFKGNMYNYYYNNRGAAVGGKWKINNQNYIDFSFDYGNYKYYNEYPYKYNESYITPDGAVKKTYYPGDRFKNSDQTTIVANLKGVFELNKKNTLSVGTEILGDYLNAQYRLTKSNVNAYTYAIYAQDELKCSKNLDVVGGVRLIYHDKFGVIATPRLSVMYKQSKFTHRFTYANGFKSPTLKQFYYYYESDRMGVDRLYLGNEDLMAQKSHYFSVSSEYKQKSFKTSLNLYVNRLYDMIDYKIIPTTWENEYLGIEETKQRYNIDDAQTAGFDWHFTIKLLSQISFSGGYSYVDAHNITQDIRLNGISEHSVTCKAEWAQDWKYYSLNINVLGNYKSDKFYLEEDLEKTYADPYQLWKLTTSQKFNKIKNLDITLIVGVDNIFNYVDDRPYGSHYGTLNPGRTLFVGVKIRFLNTSEKSRNIK